MQSFNQQTTTYGSGALPAERLQVLRNTYFLLALTMLPTAAGALLGMSMNFRVGGFLGFGILMAVSFGAFYLIEKTKDSAMGVAILLAFKGFMGMWLSQILQSAMKFSNGAEMIGIAAIGTAAIFFTLATVATVTKKDFSFMGKFLFVGAMILLLAVVANLFFAIPALSLTISAVALVIFSAYILYDVSRIINGGETNYITATLNLYLDIYNVFTSLLHLLMAFTGGDRD